MTTKTETMEESKIQKKRVVYTQMRSVFSFFLLQMACDFFFLCSASVKHTYYVLRKGMVPHRLPQ